MKKTIYNLLTLIFLSVCIISCTDEDYARNSGNESYESAVKIRLSLKSATPQTKASDNILGKEDEDAIKSLQLFIFRRGGEQLLVKDYYFSTWNNKQIIDAYTGRFIYVLVANLHEEWTGITKYSDITNKLYTIESESDISRKDTDKSLVAIFNKELLIPYPSTGSDIVELKDGTDPISLKRLCAKVNLKLLIDGVTPDNAPLKDKLNIKSIQMRNASKSMYIFNEEASLDEKTTPSTDYAIREFEADNKDYLIDDAFYILERKAADKIELGTYLEIKAEYRDTESDVPTKLITYKAKFNTESFSGNNYHGLFNVSRNKLYLLNITLQGTNDEDIRVDVEELQRNGVYVNNSATGRGTGSNWEDAFTSINDAIAFINEYNSKNVPLEYIYVKEGEYSENITMPTGVSIVGGFANALTGTDLTHDGKIKPILRPDASNATQHSIVTFPSSLAKQTTLAYFIVQGGNAENGAGISMQSNNAVIHACRVSNNRANQGAGVYMTGGEVWNCIIDNNEAVSNGAGIYIANTAQKVRIQNTTVVDNQWSGTPPPSPEGTSINPPSSGIYAASGADASAHNCILHNENEKYNLISGIDYTFCAFDTNKLLTWDEITNGNIGIYPKEITTDQPNATTVYNPDFIDYQSYQLNESSLLTQRGYNNTQSTTLNTVDFNGKSPLQPTFPDLGAIQCSKTERLFIDVYVKEATCLPFINSIVECFIASNTKEQFTSSGNIKHLDEAGEPALLAYTKNIKLKTMLANTRKQDATITGIIERLDLKKSIRVTQNYIFFEQEPAAITFDKKRNLYMMPEASDDISLELFTHQPFQYSAKYNYDKDKSTFAGIRIKGKDMSWLKVSCVSNNIKYSNQAYQLPVNEDRDPNRTFEQFSLEYLYNLEYNKTGTVTPFENTYTISQVPEWLIAENATISVLGLTEKDYTVYFEKLNDYEFGKFDTWISNISVPSEAETSDENNGRQNTADILNRYIDSGNFKWDTSSEEKYMETQNNAFIFCASLNPDVRKKLIKGANIDVSELTWYVPSINELKFISINSSLQFSGQSYYISSTLRNGKLRRYNPITDDEWNWESGDILPDYLRCVRHTNKTNAPLQGIEVINSDKSYIINSKKMYKSTTSTQKRNIHKSATKKLASQFEIHPRENSTPMLYNSAADYCASLPSENEKDSWRVPTRKEMMLIHLYLDKLAPKATFDVLDVNQFYFTHESEATNDVHIFDLKNGISRLKIVPKAKVRCVRSIQ